MDITKMGREEILALRPGDVTWFISPEELFHIAEILGAFWKYDYRAADQGLLGLHALLKSLLHSDGFFVSKILLESENIRRIMALQIIMRLQQTSMMEPDFVAGVPDGATELGKIIGEVLGIPVAKMVKNPDGHIILETEIPNDSLLLVIEDICTRGTGFREGVLAIKNRQPTARFIMVDPVLLNRGGLKDFSVEGVGTFVVLPVAEKRMNDWKADECPLCERGSEPIKPKATNENWERIINSQK